MAPVDLAPSRHLEGSYARTRRPDGGLASTGGGGMKKGSRHPSKERVDPTTARPHKGPASNLSSRSQVMEDPEKGLNAQPSRQSIEALRFFSRPQLFPVFPPVTAMRQAGATIL